MEDEARGVIALDIDGTVTAVKDRLDPEVVTYLTSLAKQRWIIYFVTGRTFHWANTLLQQLPFPYLIGAHNGAYICSMPDRTVLYRGFLEKQEVIQVSELLTRFDSTGIIYAGPDANERTYICPRGVKEDKYAYMNKRRISLQEEWIEIDNVEAIEETQFLAVRCLEQHVCAQQISDAITQQLQLSCPLMMDSCGQDYMLVQITKQGVTKGSAIAHVMDRLHITGPVIAAGDDHNDISMFEQAHVKIAMATAPQELLSLADITAPPAADRGIIQGLQLGLTMVGG